MPITPQCHKASREFYARRRKLASSKWVVDEQGAVHIPLSGGKEALIDECDRELASQFAWHLNTDKNRKLFYASTFTGTKKQILLHNLLFPVGEGKQVDHKDRNGLNCMRSNMREADKFQQSYNRQRSVGVCGYRGVTKSGNRFNARIQREGKLRHLGTFPTAEEAAVAYNSAASHSEFSVLNSLPDTN